MDVHRILEMIGKDLYIFAVSTLQLFLNRCCLSVTKIHVGMHCHLCMSPKQFTSPVADPGWVSPRALGPLTPHF